MGQKVKTKKSILKIISGLIDIIVYPVIIFSLCAGCFMLISKAEKNFTRIAGFSFVRVLSNSMSEYCEDAQRSFFKGDVCILKAKTTYSVGDVIAFYKYIDSVDEYSDKLDLTSCEESKVLPKKDKDGNIIEGETAEPTKWYPVKDENGNVVYNSDLQTLINNTPIGESFDYNRKTYTKKGVPSTRKSFQKVEKMDKIEVWFHQIVKIQIDETGTVFYITKGTANGEETTELVRSDLALGSYIPSSKWLSSFIGFCSTPNGLIMLVIVPVSIMILFEALSVLEQTNNIILEKNVISRNIMFDSKDCQKAKIFEEMAYYNKIYLYDVMPKEYKDELFGHLWGYIGNSKKKKDKKLYATALTSAQNYDESDINKYYESWFEYYSSGGQKRKLLQMKQKAENDRYKNVKIFEYQNYNPEQLKQNKISENKNTENNATLVNEKLPPKKQTEQVVEKPEIKQNSVPKQPKVPQTPQRPTQPQRPQAPQKPKQPTQKSAGFDDEDQKRLEEILGRIKKHK